MISCFSGAPRCRTIASVRVSRPRIDHVLVDEYQDVNELQVDILSGLRRADPRITVVGDDAQALYSFRAAEPRHILEFDRVFPGSTTVVLETNYRSSQQILDVANAVGADATVGFSAVLQAARTAPGVAPQLVRCADEDAQTDAVCDRVLMHREAGIALHEQAVLVRAAHHSALLELELSMRRIPYVKYGGLRFVEAAHVKDMLAAFRLADNPGDVVAWFRLLQMLSVSGRRPRIAWWRRSGCSARMTCTITLTSWPRGRPHPSSSLTPREQGQTHSSTRSSCATGSRSRPTRSVSAWRSLR